MMKTINKFLILLMLAIPFLGFNGCKDDDKGDDYASEIAGTYTGPLKLAATGDTYAESTTIKIERTGDNVATLSTTMTIDLSQYVPTMPAQEVNIQCAKSTVAKGNDGKYTITGTTKVMQMIDVAVSGIIDGSGAATINITASATLLPAPLAFIFTGSKAK